MSTGGQGARVHLPEDAGAESARIAASFLASCGERAPLPRRPDGAPRRDFLADEERTATARRLAADVALILEAQDDAIGRAMAAQAILDATDARIRHERGIRDGALWVMLADHEAQMRRTGAYTGTGWTPPAACRLVCVSRGLWKQRISPLRPNPWPALSMSEAEEAGARAGRNVYDLGILRAVILPVRDAAARALIDLGMKNVEVAEMLGITPERVAQIRSGSG